MIILYNPLSTTPGNQPLPLSLMSPAAALEGRHPWTLVDGNVARDPAAAIIAIARGLDARDELRALQRLVHYQRPKTTGF